jgi:hypothetical protein
LYIASPSKATSSGAGIVITISAIVLIIALLVFYAALGKLAKMLGRSWITWVFLTIAFSPLGLVVTYLLMRLNVNAALKAIDPPETDKYSFLKVDKETE